MGLCDHMLPCFIMQSLQGMWFRTCSNIACSRLSVCEDDGDSERVTSGMGFFLCSLTPLSLDHGGWKCDIEQ